MAAIRRKRFTARPTGSAGSAVYTEQYTLGRPGVIRFIKIDYGSGVPATADVVLKRDSSGGTTVLTRSNTATDWPAAGHAIALATPTAVDEARNAVSTFTSTTDAASGGVPFSSGFYLDVAQADPYADSTDEILVDVLWEPIRKKTITVTSNAGGAGASSGSTLWTYGRPGVVRFIEIDFGASAATTDVTIKADSASGATLFTSTDSQTDMAPSAVGTAGADETGAAMATGDSVSGGLPFFTGLHVAQAQTDSSITNTVHVWYDA